MLQYDAVDNQIKTYLNQYRIVGPDLVKLLYSRTLTVAAYFIKIFRGQLSNNNIGLRFKCGYI